MSLWLNGYRIAVCDLKWRYGGVCYYDTVKESKVRLLIEQDDFRTIFILFVDLSDETKKLRMNTDTNCNECDSLNHMSITDNSIILEVPHTERLC